MVLTSYRSAVAPDVPVINHFLVGTTKRGVVDVVATGPPAIHRERCAVRAAMKVGWVLKHTQKLGDCGIDATSLPLWSGEDPVDVASHPARLVQIHVGQLEQKGVAGIVRVLPGCARQQPQPQTSFLPQFGLIVTTSSPPKRVS